MSGIDEFLRLERPTTRRSVSRSQFLGIVVTWPISDPGNGWVHRRHRAHPVQFTSVEEVEDWVISQDPEGGEGGGSRRRFVTKRPLFADLVTYEPWLLLRIPQERFEYAATGLPVFPIRRQNLIAFAATIASRASAARLGIGLRWLGSRSPPRENRMPSQAIYHGYLRWQLTRLFLK